MSVLNLIQVTKPCFYVSDSDLSSENWNSTRKHGDTMEAAMEQVIAEQSGVWVCLNGG